MILVFFLGPVNSLKERLSYYRLVDINLSASILRGEWGRESGVSIYL